MLLCAVAERFGWSFAELRKLTVIQLRESGRFMSARPGRYCVMIEPKQD